MLYSSTYHMQWNVILMNIITNIVATASIPLQQYVAVP